MMRIFAGKLASIQPWIAVVVRLTPNCAPQQQDKDAWLINQRPDSATGPRVHAGGSERPWFSMYCRRISIGAPPTEPAFLARFVHNDRLDASQVRAAWPGAEALL